MKRTLCSSLIGMLVLLGTFSLSISNTWAKNASSAPERNAIKVTKKLDLRVQKMEAVKIGTVGTSDKVRITVSVIATTNRMNRVCTGPFKVKVSKDQGGTWRYLAQGGVSNLCVGGPSIGAIKKLTFTDTVPSDMHGAQKYRAEVDYDNRVVETNESNNIGGTRYMRSGFVQFDYIPSN